MFEQGLGQLGATLAARNLAYFRNVWITNAQSPTGGWVQALLPPDTGSEVILLGSVVNLSGGGFPFGWPVPPDEPL